jgi:hypothetical protein
VSGLEPSQTKKMKVTDSEDPLASMASSTCHKCALVAIGEPCSCFVLGCASKCRVCVNCFSEMVLLLSVNSVMTCPCCNSSIHSWDTVYPQGVIAGVMRSEKIDRALSITKTIHEQLPQDHQQTATSTSIMHDALLERLEARLLKNEMECTKLQELADTTWKGSYLLEKVEALILVKKEECIKVRNLVEKTRRRGTKIRNFKESMTTSARNVSQSLLETQASSQISVDDLRLMDASS